MSVRARLALAGRIPIPLGAGAFTVPEGPVLVKIVHL
jgi:hypothetical protein